MRRISPHGEVGEGCVLEVVTTHTLKGRKKKILITSQLIF
jgi:hypothetical protein